MAQSAEGLPGSLRVRGAVRSDMGPGHTENQDAVGSFPDLGFYAIADGVGGHAGGQVASSLSIEALYQSLVATKGQDLTPVTVPTGRCSVSGRRLLIALHDANERVLETGRDDPALRGMGAAIAAVLFDPGYDLVAIGNVGDARVYRIRADRIEQLTEDQTVVQRLLQEGRIAEEDIPRSPHRHMLTQAVGLMSDIEPGLRLEQPVAGDVFVLSSDGLHDVVRADDILKAVRDAAGDVEQACARLVQLAAERGSNDDTSVFVLACAAGASNVREGTRA